METCSNMPHDAPAERSDWAAGHELQPLLAYLSIRKGQSVTEHELVARIGRQ